MAARPDGCRFSGFHVRRTAAVRATVEGNGAGSHQAGRDSPATTAPSAAAAKRSSFPFGDDAWLPLFIVLGAALVALAFGAYWWQKTMKQDPGSERMHGVAGAVQEGAMAYLARQVKTMIPLVILIGIGLFFLYKSQYAFMEAHEPGISMTLGFGVAIAFLLGVTASYLAGYVGMGVAVRGNVRVANAALSSFKRALEIAFQAGAVSGMFTVGLGLLGATITFMVFKENAMFVLVGFGFGGIAGRAVHARRRRHLHQGGRRGRGPGGQGGSGHSRGRSAQRGDDRR